jgi:hypothetical protein
MYAVSRVRRDVKVVTNRMLTHLEPSARCLFRWTIWAAGRRNRPWCRWNSICKTRAC